MSEYVYIGKIVNTHGIKGELKILSDFDKKELVFKSEFYIYIGKSKIKEKINTYRRHKNFDMITLENYNNINEVLKYKGKEVYVKRGDLNLKEGEYILSDLLLGKIIYNDKVIGKVSEIVLAKLNILLKIKGEKEFFIPYNKEFIKKVDIRKQEIIVENIEGLII